MSRERAVNICFQGFVVSKEPRVEGLCHGPQPTPQLSQPPLRGCCSQAELVTICKISRAFVQVAALRWLLLYQLLFALLPKDDSPSENTSNCSCCMVVSSGDTVCSYVLSSLGICFTPSWQPLHHNELLMRPVRAYTLQSVKVVYYSIMIWQPEMDSKAAGSPWCSSSHLPWRKSLVLKMGGSLEPGEFMVIKINLSHG